VIFVEGTVPFRIILNGGVIFMVYFLITRKRTAVIGMSVKVKSDIIDVESQLHYSAHESALGRSV